MPLVLWKWNQKNKNCLINVKWSLNFANVWLLCNIMSLSRAALKAKRGVVLCFFTRLKWLMCCL